MCSGELFGEAMGFHLSDGVERHAMRGPDGINGAIASLEIFIGPTAAVEPCGRVRDVPSLSAVALPGRPGAVQPIEQFVGVGFRKGCAVGFHRGIPADFAGIPGIPSDEPSRVITHSRHSRRGFFGESVRTLFL